jgi:hypothetical protein
MFALAVAALLFAAPGDPGLSAAGSNSAATDAATKADNPVTHPIWTRRPSQNDLMRLYPRGVRGIRATVVASCLIDVAGKFSSCEITREDPGQMGFGDATIRLSKLFQMKATDGDGAPVAGRRLVLPVVWYAEYGG